MQLKKSAQKIFFKILLKMSVLPDLVLEDTFALGKMGMIKSVYG